MKIFLKQKNRAPVPYEAKSFRSGFTLVETLVAISIFTMSVLGLMSVLASGLSDTSYAKQKMTATYLAQEGIEYARNLRDNAVIPSGGLAGWASFITPLPRTISYPITNPDISDFDRIITITSAGTTDKVKVTSVVTWRSGVYNVTLSEYLYNWVE